MAVGKTARHDPVALGNEIEWLGASFNATMIKPLKFLESDEGLQAFSVSAATKHRFQIQSYPTNLRQKFRVRKHQFQKRRSLKQFHIFESRQKLHLATSCR